MTSVRQMQPVSAPVHGAVRPPGSKSLTNRALIVAGLAEGRSHLTGVLDSQDTRVMVESLRRLGLELDQDVAAGTIAITGCGGHPTATAADLFLENSGTSIRFLTAMCALGTGTFRLDGNARMRERPILDLVEGLRQLGVDVTYSGNNGFPPVIVRGTGLAGGTATVASGTSSQFLSGLLMAAPGATAPVTLEIGGSLVSEPYVTMTIAVMRTFGATVDAVDGGFRIQPGRYQANAYHIEPDASAASYFFGAAAVTGGRVTVEGLSRQALQGDVGFVDALERMGCEVEASSDSITVVGRTLSGIDIDMNAISDTAQTLACVAPFANSQTRIRNVAHMRHKETDRIAAVATELRKVGLSVDEHADGLTIYPGPIQPARIATYDDHRMAMSFSLLGLRAPGIEIEHPECTAKTYPHFFTDLDRLCGR
jgi:3-phosphoshikimate 1-carboxyvinyltransferase